jgi:hypothetical protein
MIRTQIQLPDPLYRDVQRVARQQDWSIAEVIRRGAEAVVRAYPPDKRPPTSAGLPPPLKSRLLVSDPAALRAAIRADEEAKPS